MPRKQTTCVRKPGHAPPCMTAANMASRRAYRRAHPHLESPESRKKSNRQYRIASYGLTQDDFDLLLKMQGYACGMCRELFARGAASPCGPRPRVLPGEEPVVRQVRARTALPRVQHCTGPHPTPVCDGSRVPKRATPVGGTPSMKGPRPVPWFSEEAKLTVQALREHYKCQALDRLR